MTDSSEDHYSARWALLDRESLLDFLEPFSFSMLTRTDCGIYRAYRILASVLAFAMYPVLIALMLNVFTFDWMIRAYLAFVFLLAFTQKQFSGRHVDKCEQCQKEELDS